MRSAFGQALIGLSGVLGGLVVGYLLYVPVLAIPMEFGVGVLRPLLTSLASHLPSPADEYLVVALASFLLHLPNTIALAAVSAIVLRTSLPGKRLALYAVFCWPALSYANHWFEVWRLGAAARRLGLPDGIDQLPTDVYIGVKAMTILLTYGFFLAAVFGLVKLRTGKAAPAS